MTTRHWLADLLLITMLAIVSTLYIWERVIEPNIDMRMAFEKRILAGEAKPPYRFRVLKPAMHLAIDKAIAPVVESDRERHAIASVAVAFATLWLTFFFFLHFLQYLFPRPWAWVGVLLLQIVIPLSITGEYMVGDFVTVLFYAVGLNLIVRYTHWWIPIVVAIGAFNREQIVFLLVFQAAYLASNRGALRRYWPSLVLGVAAYVAVFFGLRQFLGNPISEYTAALHIAHNTDRAALINDIIPLWTAQVAILVLLSAMAFRKSGLFFKLCFLCLIPYTVLFFLNGNLWEMAKYLPAFLILIPMSLQTLSGHTITFWDIAKIKYADPSDWVGFDEALKEWRK